MESRSDQFEELQGLLSDLLDDRLTSSQQLRLAVILRDSDEARRIYAQHIALHVIAEYQLEPDIAQQFLREMQGGIGAEGWSAADKRTDEIAGPACRRADDEQSAQDNARLPVVFPGLGTYLGDVESPLGASSIPIDRESKGGEAPPRGSANVHGGRQAFSEWARGLLARPTPMAMTWATFAVLCALIVLGLWPAIDRGQAPAPAIGSVERFVSDGWYARPVARLVRVVDGEWSGATDWIEGAELMADQTLELKSGRAMVLFYGGASAVLRGPASIRIKSASDMALESGMLVASVPSQAAVGFRVTTPNACVASLNMGSSFNISFDESEGTRAYVERGQVRASTSAGAASPNSSIVVVEASGLRVALGASSIEHISYKSAPFEECQLPTFDPASLHEIAHFRMGEGRSEWRLGEPASAELFAVDGHSKLLRHGLPAWSEGQASGGRAVRFGGRDLYAAPCLVRNFDQWILETRVRPAVDNASGIVFYNGDPSHTGFGLLCDDGSWKVLFGGVALLKFGAPVKADRWTDLAVACFRGRVRLFVDGQPIGEPALVLPRSPNAMLTIGGHLVDVNPQFFQGDIDEIRLSVFEGPFHADMLKGF